VPIYRHRCRKCLQEYEELKKVDERFDGTCPNCGSMDSDLLIGSSRKGWDIPQGGMWFEHLDEHPVFVETKQQLREECRKRSTPERTVYAKCLD